MCPTRHSCLRTRPLTLDQPVAVGGLVPQRPVPECSVPGTVREPPDEDTIRDGDLRARDRPAALGPR
jgi:hypothetical protein